MFDDHDLKYNTRCFGNSAHQNQYQIHGRNGTSHDQVSPRLNIQQNLRAKLETDLQRV